MSGDCHCEGDCGGSSSSTATQGQACGGGATAQDPPSGSCGGGCGGGCDDCAERERVGALNWGRFQADAQAGLSEFWRQAMIGDAFLLKTGDTLPSEVQSAVGRLESAARITGYRRHPSRPEIAAQPRTVAPAMSEAGLDADPIWLSSRSALLESDAGRCCRAWWTAQAEEVHGAFTRAWWAPTEGILAHLTRSWDTGRWRHGGEVPKWSDAERAEGCKVSPRVVGWDERGREIHECYQDEVCGGQCQYSTEQKSCSCMTQYMVIPTHLPPLSPYQVCRRSPCDCNVESDPIAAGNVGDDPGPPHDNETNVIAETKEQCQWEADFQCFVESG